MVKDTEAGQTGKQIQDLLSGKVKFSTPTGGSNITTLALSILDINS
ncbi:hypothetical protein [Neisseria dentiae]|nr:hypothetical protein [Neisseria dentiae]QMT45350.1 hypothetical protein H3L92_00365 [Neisseria dentiae]